MVVKKVSENEIKLKELELRKEQNQLWRDALQKGTPILDKYLDKKSATESSRVKWSIIGIIGMLFVVTVISGFLVYAGRIDGSNFTFLMGTLIGASIALLGDLLIPTE